jgi:Isochorismatase family
VDHQSGLISLVQDYSPGEFQNNILALADIAKYYQLPTILTTSFEEGPNGLLVPELKALFPNAPYIPRPGQINARDNEDFVKAVKATGRRQLIIAGVVTDVCVAFPTLWPSRRKCRKIYASEPGRKLKFLARPLDTRIDTRKSTGCTDTVAANFWPFCVERRPSGSCSPFFQQFERPLNACLHADNEHLTALP